MMMPFLQDLDATLSSCGGNRTKQMRRDISSSGHPVVSGMAPTDVMQMQNTAVNLPSAQGNAELAALANIRRAMMQELQEKERKMVRSIPWGDVPNEERVADVCS